MTLGGLHETVNEAMERYKDERHAVAAPYRAMNSSGPRASSSGCWDESFSYKNVALIICRACFTANTSENEI